MSDVNFENNYSLNNFLVITKTTQYGQVEANLTNVTSARLLIESAKIAQAAGEFPN